MAKHIMENVWLLQIIELLRRPDKIACRKTAIGEMVENTSSGTKPGTATICQPVAAINRAFNSR